MFQTLSNLVDGRAYSSHDTNFIFFCFSPFERYSRIAYAPIGLSL
uniref:Uncharacterized protein n=1 Tax=virus sp. ctkyY8 TaxID=2827995 RepID=A0A8S5REQ3_9VIRU|nr:MAG TPA: hypothetical protein [virus sp. ctkyY8]